MQVLLTTLNAKYIHTNLAIRLLYEQNQGREGLAWKEFTIKQNPGEVARYCSSFDLVAFSCYIWNITQTLDLVARLKALRPGIKILLGGPEVSYEWENVIARNTVDYIIVGEGEIPFAAFLDSYPQVDQVPGLVFKKEGAVHCNPAPPLFDLKQLEHSMPYRFDREEDLHNKVLYIETSRGCPYKCEFCLASLDNKVRYLPDATIKATLLHLMRHGRVIKFLDRTFNIKRDFTLGIFRFILGHYRPGNVFQFEITADILHPDIVRFIDEEVPPGLFRFEIGIQTLNKKANLEVSRKQDFEKTRRIITSLSHKVEMHLDLIVGLPLDYWDDIKHSFDEVFRLFAPELQLGFLKFLKGTPVRDKHNRHGFVFAPEAPYQVLESNYLSREQLGRIVKLEEALEIYWNGKKAVNTLKYASARYGGFDFLLGLGELFESRRKSLHYSINDVFGALSAYAEERHPGDEVLKQLVAVDYYLHFKLRPRPFVLTESSVEESARLAAELGLEEQGQRYVALHLSFDFACFAQTNEVLQQPQRLLLAYDGLCKARVVGSLPVSGNIPRIVRELKVTEAG